MKTVLVLIAVFALAYGAAVPKEEKKDAKADKPKEDKPTEKPIEKPAEKKDEKSDDGRLQWPQPDPRSEGDLILHGSHLFDRVEELRKAKPENDVDKMILSVGRDFLRKCHKYLEATPDFKIVPALCRDSRELTNNGTRRWEIRLQPEHQPAAVAGEEKKEEANKDNKQQPEQPKPQNDATATKTKRDAAKKEEEKKDKDASKDSPKPDEPKGNSTEANGTDPAIPKPESDAPREGDRDRDNYEARRRDFYSRTGDNFARLLLKSWRKEKLSEEERAFVEDWSNEEAIHYGTMGIYCQQGENVKELIKKIKEIVDEK
jgi:hypothetical protein